MTDAEVITWIEQHVSGILMSVAGPLRVTWIDDDGCTQMEVCDSLRELAEKYS